VIKEVQLLQGKTARQLTMLHFVMPSQWAPAEYNVNDAGVQTPQYFTVDLCRNP